MKQLVATSLLTLVITFSCLSQVESELPWKLGNSKEFIEKDLKAKGGNITYGINDDGLAYISDQDWDGLVAYYFNDESICIANYSVIRSENGKKALVELKMLFAKNGKKVKDNIYLVDGLYYTFSNPERGAVGMLVSKEIK